MAKSRIIKDLANGEVDTITALKRAKVLLADLGNAEILEWINNEITGYPEDADLPSYRKTTGLLKGSYFKGSIATHMTYTNVSLPLGRMPEDRRKALLEVSFREGAEALVHLVAEDISENGSLAKVLPADYFPTIAHYNNDPYMIITSARVEFGAQCIKDILSSIENKLLDILLLLEKEFGNLDELDLDCERKSKKELQSISASVVNIIFNDNRVSIGDGNKIKDSTIASSLNDD